MDISKENFSRAEQEKLFDSKRDSIPGSFDDDRVIRAVITDSIKRCPKKRLEIAEEMSFLLGRNISEGMLNSFTAESREEHRWPFCWTRAFCHSTGDWRLLRAIVDRTGFLLIANWEKPLLELGERVLATEITQREIEGLKEQVMRERRRA